MVAKRHENKMQGSGIRAIITYTGDNCGTLGPRFDIQKQDYSTEEMPRDQLAKFLNKAAGRDGSEKEISEELEKAIVNDFSDVLSEEEDIYIYTGCKSLSSDEAWQLTLKQVREKEYKSAPQRIIRFNNKLVVDENWQVLPIGITPMRISLSAKKLGKSSTEQSNLNQAVCTAAQEFTLLPHIKYKDSMYGRDNANGTMPDLFFKNTRQYSFRSRQAVKTSDAIRSIFAEQIR